MKDLASATWADLTTVQPNETKTPIERTPIADLPEGLHSWREQGVIILRGLIPDHFLDAYSESRTRALSSNRNDKDNFWNGWHHATPYLDNPELMDVATHPSLMEAMRYLIGEEMAVHLTLTGWVSTERNWHQDTYLNPDYLWSHYAAAWIALDDVCEHAGPFEFVEGSHLWPALRRSKLFEHLTQEQQDSADWPTITQDQVARACEDEIARRGVEPQKFIAKKGDVLIWHSNLVHRGTAPTNPALLRKALICHYSAIKMRFDMHRLSRNPRNGQVYFDFPDQKRPS